MQRNRSMGTVGTLGYGGVLINTMPIWLVWITAISDAGEALPGVLASVVLLTAAAGCGFGNRVMRNDLLRVTAFLVMLIPALGVFSGTIAPAVLLSAGALFGLAFGLLLYLSLRVLLAIDESARAIGDTLADALVVSLTVLLIVTAYPHAILPILSALSLIPAAIAIVGRVSKGTEPSDGTLLRLGWHSLRFLGFFIAMGAYWAFLEVHADQRALGPISAWLFGGLLASAAGAALAACVPSRSRKRVMLLSMLSAAVSGGATYATAVPSIVGTSIRANGFFLFVFFPLYLGAANAG